MIIYLKEMKQLKNKHFSIVIRTNISSNMEPYLDLHYKELEKEFSGDKRFMFFFRPVGNWGGDNIKSMSDCIYDALEFKNIYQKIIDMNLKLDFGRFVSFYDNSMCSACYENSYIFGHDGKIYKCSCHFENIGNDVGKLDFAGVPLFDNTRLRQWVGKAELAGTNCGWGCFGTGVGNGCGGQCSR